jgi:hypothetical protein
VAWEVRFFADGRALAEVVRGAPSQFRAERDALTHARFLLHGAPRGLVEVRDRDDARSRAVYRLVEGRMVALAERP